MSETKSFQPVILMPNQRLTGWPTPYPTPWPTPAPTPTRRATVAYVVDAEPRTIDRDLVKTWFIQSVTPLVGPKAACDLEGLIKVGDEPWNTFLDDAIEFISQSLAPK